MTAAGRQQPKLARRERRIIERPRLIKLLDETEARIILLLAPAGYGKTTLARQWVKTLSGVIWISATPAHRDVVVFAEDVAAGIDNLGGNASKFIGEYLRARSNPQRAAREVAGALVERMNDARVQWLAVDDYHECCESPEIEEMLRVLIGRVSGRLLVASRVRPKWATTRRALYEEVREVRREELAMTQDESSLILGCRPELEPIASHAQGWPAVLTLAAGLESAAPPTDVWPSVLHRYVAEELYQSATDELQDQLLSLALLPGNTARSFNERFGSRAQSFLARAKDLGFISDDEARELHPLLREFLLAKLAEAPQNESRIREAVLHCIDCGAWDNALELVTRFDLVDLIDPLLECAYKPLVRSGRLGTLSRFAARIRDSPGFPPATVDVVEAEVSLRDGQFDLALELAERHHSRLPETHPLKSRVAAIIGHSQFFLISFKEAEAAFESARRTALDEFDEAEAIHGLAVTTILGERGSSAEPVSALAAGRHRSPVHLVRYATAELSRRRFDEGLREPLYLAEPLHALKQVEDPRARTAFTYTAANVLGQRADYRHAQEFLRLFLADAQAFGLEFAMPLANWTSAFLKLGLRRFGEAGRCIQLVEDAVEHRQHESHALNARILRSRLLLQTGQPHEALAQVEIDDELPVIPSWRGEYLATRAVALACLGDESRSEDAANRANSTSRAVEVRVLTAAARAILSASRGDISPGLELIQLADRLGAWDPVVCATRASRSLGDLLASDSATRPTLMSLYERSNDLGLSRRAGFRTPSRRPPAELLSARESEVLALIARGLRNREIADALFIAESTAKVHVRHVLEKLGVRTRVEAVARFEQF